MKVCNIMCKSGIHIVETNFGIDGMQTNKHIKNSVNLTGFLNSNPHLRKRKWKLLFGFALFLCLLILNFVMYWNKAGERKKLVVVIDAGHGGNDPGKVNVDGVKEKDVNLEIAYCLKAQLQARGVAVIMTRQGDDSLATAGATNKKVSDMHNRVSLINEAKADYLISIHQNSYPDGSVSGPQVFYHGESERSEMLAKKVQNNLIDELSPPKIREVKAENSYYILKNSICPGIIVECGFLSCPEECDKLLDRAYQQKIATAISRAICDE